MYFQNEKTQNRRKIQHSPLFKSLNNFQWKKANKNLQTFIECQHLGVFKNLPKNRDDVINNKNKEKLSLMRSFDYSQLNKQKSQRNEVLQTQRQKIKSSKLLFKNRSLQRLQDFHFLQKKQINLVSLGIQTFDEEMSMKKRNLAQENQCLKDLIQILEKQILDYSRKISETEALLFQINQKCNDMKVNMKKLCEDNCSLKQKLKRQNQMNFYLQYIVSQLNQKLSRLIKQNSNISDQLQEYLKNQKIQQKDTQNYSEIQQELSTHSACFHKQQFTSQSKNCDNIIEGVQSNIILDDQMNWSFNALQTSSFNKTPNKIHDMSISGQFDRTPNEISQLIYSQSIDLILSKHKNEINKLTQKVKYYQIQNSMLKRKKQLYQKNSEEIHQLKKEISKLAEQNKIIKLIQSKKSKQSNADTNWQKEQNQKQKGEQIIVKNNDQQIQDINRKSFLEQDRITFKNILKQKQLNQNKVKQVSRRQSPLQRKFVRKQLKSMRSPSKVEQDSEVSLQLSPERL